MVEQNAEPSSEHPPPTEPSQNAEMSETPVWLATTGTGAGGAIAGALAAAPIVEAVVAAMGFTEAGIAAGSAAAAMMSAEAITAGGGVLVGGNVATLQSIGAVGLAGGPLTAAIVVGSIAGAVLVGGITYAIVSNMRALSFQPVRMRGLKKDKSMVLMEEGWGNVVTYPFDSFEKAQSFFDLVTRERPSRPRILYDTKGIEVKSGGWNFLALPTIRKYHSCSKVNFDNNSVADAGNYFGLEPGSLVALHSPEHNRFLWMDGERVHSAKAPDHLGKDAAATDAALGSTLICPQSLFEVVDACSGCGRQGEIALYSQVNKRFVRLIGESVDGCGGETSSELPHFWDSERFTVVDAGNSKVALHSHSHNRFMRLDNRENVNALGGPRDVDSLPDCWGSERFRVLCAKGYV
mmetsp:Transcript_13300/g.32058  ORF Transcript_13300/g.32058 Transcript_13300/m.32058 type:complete len:407 (-) Transcript_13300:466-1686(-)